jgi:hypothetical protein
MTTSSNGSATSLGAWLLVHATMDKPSAAHQPVPALGPDAQAQRQFEWLMRGGLGPLLYHALGERAQPVPEPWRDALLAAELSARVRQAQQQETAAELIAACARLGVEPVLLKGISVSEQFYPAPHLRPMSDIDVLLPEALHERLVSALTGEGGFELTAFDDAPGMHHGAPLRHRARGTLVEVHRALFPRRSPLHACSLFSADAVLARAVPSSWQGRPVRRLPLDVQLAYIAASWFNDMVVFGFQPSFLPSLFDAAYLLRRQGAALDWGALRAGLDDDMARGCLYTLLTYLPRFGGVSAPQAFTGWLAGSQPVVGPLQLRLIHRMLDRHLLGARPWTLPLPPPMPGRYSPTYQWHKRVQG